ncbi:MAG: hypothetical protein IBX55_18780 [Methyloprofundus sp.]|nr:hypothetical protein [Methyloprofundus sp.]
MLSITKIHWVSILSITLLFAFAWVPEVMAYVPQKPNIDLGEIVNEGDSIDKTLGNLIGYGVMFVGLMIGLGSLIGMGYAAYNTIMRLIDENDKFAIKDAVILIFMVAVIGIAGVVIAFMVFGQGMTMRGA